MTQGRTRECRLFAGARNSSNRWNFFPARVGILDLRWNVVHLLLPCNIGLTHKGAVHGVLDERERLQGRATLGLRFQSEPNKGLLRLKWVLNIVPPPGKIPEQAIENDCLRHEHRLDLLDVPAAECYGLTLKLGD